MKCRIKKSAIYYEEIIYYNEKHTFIRAILWIMVLMMMNSVLGMEIVEKYDLCDSIDKIF